MNDVVLDITGLQVLDRRTGAPRTPVLGFRLRRGELLGIAGPSGAGKSLTLKAVMGLMPSSLTQAGEVVLCGRSLARASEKERRWLRESLMGLVMQNPMGCFDPTQRIGSQLSHLFTTGVHRRNPAEIRRQSVALLEQMNLDHGEALLHCYPHELSGGMLQRIMIGMSMHHGPAVFLADEPTTAVDAENQMRITGQLQEMKASGRSGMVVVSHDIGFLEQLTDRILYLMPPGQGEEDGVSAAAALAGGRSVLLNAFRALCGRETEVTHG